MLLVPVRLVPVRVTIEPGTPMNGLTAVRVGPDTLKLAVLVTVPKGAVTLMRPLALPAGTGTVICVSEFTTKPGAATPLKATAVVPVKLVPVMTTLVPAVPLVGVKLLMVGVTQEIAAAKPAR